MARSWKKKNKKNKKNKKKTMYGSNAANSPLNGVKSIVDIDPVTVGSPHHHHWQSSQAQR